MNSDSAQRIAMRSSDLAKVEENNGRKNKMHPILWRPYQCSKSRGIEVQGREYVVVR